MNTKKGKITLHLGNDAVGKGKDTFYVRMQIIDPNGKIVFDTDSSLPSDFKAYILTKGAMRLFKKTSQFLTVPKGETKAFDIHLEIPKNAEGMYKIRYFIIPYVEKKPLENSIRQKTVPLKIINTKIEKKQTPIEKVQEQEQAINVLEKEEEQLIIKELTYVKKLENIIKVAQQKISELKGIFAIRLKTQEIINIDFNSDEYKLLIKDISALMKEIQKRINEEKELVYAENSSMSELKLKIDTIISHPESSEISKRFNTLNNHFIIPRNEHLTRINLNLEYVSSYLNKLEDDLNKSIKEIKANPQNQEANVELLKSLYAQLNSLILKMEQILSASKKLEQYLNPEHIRAELNWLQIELARLKNLKNQLAA